jgi:hypothetical protein
MNNFQSKAEPIDGGLIEKARAEIGILSRCDGFCKSKLSLELSVIEKSF